MAPVDVESGKYECDQRTLQQFFPVHHYHTSDERSHCGNYQTLVHVSGAYDDEIVRPQRVDYRTGNTEPRLAAQCKEQYITANECGKDTSDVTARSPEDIKGKHIAQRLVYICRLWRVCIVARHSRKHGVRPVGVLPTLLVIILCILTPGH